MEEGLMAATITERTIEVPELVREIAARLGGLPEVTAIALGGSTFAGNADERSDVDFYVYSRQPPPLALRTELARAHDPLPELDNQAFGPGDEWTDAVTGLAVDLNYWTPAWIEQQLARVLDEHLPSVGYSTCFWRTVLHSQPLVDRTGWFAALQAMARRPYPEPLRRAIVANNRPLLRDAHSSFLHQIERAIARHDPVSVQHRATILLASYFDILFALNRVPHPGEKRLLTIARRECPLLPPDLEGLIGDLIAAIPPPWGDGRLVVRAHALIDRLDVLLGAEGLS
jgi:predicted nucleotidyltransferase